MGLREISACLRAVFQPSEPDRLPLRKSRSLKEAIERMESEAAALEQEAGGKPPFCQTIKTVSERM